MYIGSKWQELYFYVTFRSSWMWVNGNDEDNSCQNSYFDTYSSTTFNKSTDTVAEGSWIGTISTDNVCFTIDCKI